MIYDEGLNSDFCNFITEKVGYNLHTTLDNLLSSDLCESEFLGGNIVKIYPLFNFDTVTSSNSLNHTENNNVLIVNNYYPSTLFSFKSNQPVLEYEENVSETIIDNIKYTLHYTYDSVTGEPAPYKKTSNGNITDEYGYYLDSEVVQ